MPELSGCIPIDAGRSWPQISHTVLCQVTLVADCSSWTRISHPTSPLVVQPSQWAKIHIAHSFFRSPFIMDERSVYQAALVADAILYLIALSARRRKNCVAGHLVCQTSIQIPHHFVCAPFVADDRSVHQIALVAGPILHPPSLCLPIVRRGRKNRVAGHRVCQTSIHILHHFVQSPFVADEPFMWRDTLAAGRSSWTKDLLTKLHHLVPSRSDCQPFVVDENPHPAAL